MKRFCIFILSICIFLSIGAAYAAAREGEAAAFDLDGMTVEELLLLKREVDQALDRQGYAVYFDLERNAKGEEVSRVQTRLAELDFYSGKITGKYDTETQKAFKLFEKKNNLSNDGNASAADQRLLFGSQAIGNASVTAVPKATATPVPEKYQAYDTLDYGAYARNPENFFFRKVKLVGKVVQVLGNRKEGFQVRLATAGDQDVVYVFVKFDPGYNILENDRMTVYAVMQGQVTYTTVRGDKITIPAAYADEIVLR